MKRHTIIGMAAMLICVLYLSGCSDIGANSSETAAPTPTADPFAVDIQVPYVTNEPTAEPGNIIYNKPESAIRISSDGKVTVMNDSWDENSYESVDQTGYVAQLRKGDSGNEVKKLQDRLRVLGYYEGEITGEFDDATESALMAFESFYYEKAYGVATVRLQSLLYSESAIPAGGPVQTVDGQDDDGNNVTVAVPKEFRELSLGAEGEDVVSLQQRLRQLGYLYGSVTGTYDYYTACAIMRFEAAYGQKPTGVATEKVQEYVYKEDAREINSQKDKAGSTGQFMSMKKNHKGADVSLMQRRLVELGYSSGEPNGKLNSYTVKLLKKFQQNAEIPVTGKADADTLRVLYGSGAPRGDE